MSNSCCSSDYCHCSTSSNYDELKVSNFLPCDEKMALSKTQNAFNHGYKNIVDISESWNPKYAWLTQLDPCNNIIRLNSFYSMASWLCITLPKSLKNIIENDLNNLHIVGSVYVPIKTGQKEYDYTAVTYPIISYNKDTNNIEISFQALNTFINEPYLLPYKLKINKNKLLP